MTESTGQPTPRRANGEGSIYETADGRLRGAIAWTDAQGKRRRKLVSGRTRAEVRRALRKVRSEIDQGRGPAPTGTVADFLDAWLVASRQRIRAATHRQYEQAVRLYLKPALGRLQLGKMTPSDIEAMTAAMVDRGLSARSAALARTVLRRALADAVRDGRVHRNVAALARPPHVASRSLRAGVDYLDGAQLRQLINACKVHPLGPLVIVSAATGIRQGEALGLTWGDVDLEARTLTVRRSLARAWSTGPDGEPVQTFALSEPKTARSRRTVNLPAVAVAALKRQQELQEAARAAVRGAWRNRDDLVFTTAVGTPLAGHDVNHAFHRILSVAGLPSIPYHGLRHSCATAMLAGGTPLEVVSRQLGHASIVLTVDRYAGTVPAQRRQAADAMDRVLS